MPADPSRGEKHSWIAAWICPDLKQLTI